MSFIHQNKKRVLATIGVLLIAFLAVVGYQRWQVSSDVADPQSDAGPFEVVDAAHRELDGSPALGLSFSLPLDATVDYGKHVQILEMPADQNSQAANQSTESDDEYSNESATGQEASVSRDDKDTALDNGEAVAGAWVVGENPRLLYFPHIKPQARYVVRIQAGLPAKGGKKLDAETRFSIRTAAVAPAFYFASRGTVLPAGQNGGLPVTTVNVPEVDVQFLKVKPDQLAGFLEKVVAGSSRPVAGANDDGDGDTDADSYYYERALRLQGAVSNWELDPLHKMTESAFVGRFVTEQKPNRRAVTFLPVETIPALREPGVYVAVMSQPNRFRQDYQTTYFYVSDLGLHLRQYAGEGADAYISSLTSGKALSGVEVSWLDEKGKVLGRAESDADGRAHFGERPKGAKVILAKKDEQISLIALKEPALDLGEFDVAGMPYVPVRLFAYSGRDLYRPGERFDVSVMARDDDGEPVPPQPLQAILRRPDGKAQWTATWQPEAKFAGYYRHAIELPADAETGSWGLELRADPAARIAATVMRFNVEEFLPERMKLDLDAGNTALSVEDGMTIDVTGRYLYGAPAAGNRLLGVVNTERNENPLSGQLPGFVFGDADEDTVHSRNELEESALDDAGRAQVSVDLGPVDKRRSPFTVRATLSLLESGGRPVVRSVERVVWPAPVLVGVRPMFTGEYAREGSTPEFEVVRSDAEAQLHTGISLPVRLFRENRSWYWRFDDQRGWHSGFSESDELVATSQVTVPEGGRGKLALPVKYGRYRLEVFDPETGLTNRFRFYAGWFAKDDETQGIRPDRVALKFDKPAYADGDTAKLTITPPHAGEALVTVEGDEVLWIKRVAVGADGTTLDIPLDKDWRRHDLYVTAMVLRPGSEGEKVTPARALGIAHLPLERSDRKLAVTLDAPEKMRPDQPLKVKVKVPEAKGQSAVVTLSAVDAGILNITSYASPDPHGFFFAKLRYGADDYDIYGRLIEKLAGQKGKLKWGGDSAPAPTQSMPKKVRLVDLFSGPVALDENGEAEVSLPVPDFNGSLRLMAAVATDSRFGMQDREVVVAAPIVVELATPRFLSVGDSATLAMDVQNMAGQSQDIKISVSNADGLKIKNGEQQVTLKDQQKKVLSIPFDAGRALGLTEVNVRIESPLMSLDRTFPLQVQAATPRQTVMRRFVVQPGESVVVKENDPFNPVSGLLEQSVSATLSLSDKAPIDVKGAVQGLLTYPYGCGEQTTSTAYPHVFIDEAEARQFGLKPFTQAQRVEMLDKAIARLGGLQAPNGGFSLWGNVSEYEYWLSAYITHFLTDAREQGFTVPVEMEKKAVEFLLKGLQDGIAGLPTGTVAYSHDSVWNDYRYAGSGRFGVLAYGAYVLARQGKAPLATLRQLHDSQAQAHSGLALVHLGLALKLMGDEERSASAIAAGLKKTRQGDYWWGDYGSNLRDWALMYVLLNKHQLNPEGRDNLVNLVAGEMQAKRYYSTQEKLALFLLGRSFLSEPGEEWSAELQASARGSSAQQPAAVPVGGKGTQFKALEAADLAAGVTIRNTHSERLFLELSYSGNPATMPSARRDVFDLKRTWYTADGKAMGRGPLRVGETYIVRVNVKSNGRYANALIVDHVPAGVEIENTNIVQGEQAAVMIDQIDMREAMQNQRIKHVEFRDDRFVVAARLDYEMDFFYRVRVVTPGSFVMPPTYAEDMYQPMIYGLAGGGETVNVIGGEGSGG